MDPFSHGLLGGLVALSFGGKSKARLAALCGFVAAIVVDFMWLFSSALDPLLVLEYRQNFSHSLIFIPFGAVIVSILLYLILRKKLSFSDCYIFCLLGFATHAIMDACSTHGVELFWPFSNELIAWNLVAEIDPFLSLILFVSFAVSVIRRSALLAMVGLVFFLCYMSLAAWQQQRVLQMVSDVAKVRHHKILRLKVVPTFGNIILWRTIYQHRGDYVVDAIRMPIVKREPILYEGLHVPAFDVDDMFPGITKWSVQRRDIQRFSYFADGYVYLDYRQPNMLMDLRYSSVPNALGSDYGIEFNEDKQNDHVEIKKMDEPLRANFKFGKMLKGVR